MKMVPKHGDIGCDLAVLRKEFYAQKVHKMSFKDQRVKCNISFHVYC